MRKSFTHRFLLDPCNPCWHPFPHWSPVKASSREKVFYREKIFCREKVFIREKVQPRKRFSSQEKVFQPRKVFFSREKVFHPRKGFAAEKSSGTKPQIWFHTPNFLNFKPPPLPPFCLTRLPTTWVKSQDRHLCRSIWFLPKSVEWSSVGNLTI